MINLTPHERGMVEKILRDYLAPADKVKTKVIAFGSRVTGKGLKVHSDLDLCVKMENAVPDTVMVKLRDAFEHSDLPMRVDVVDWAACSPVFQDIIRQSGEDVPY